jgi:hypothetical protein
MDLVNELFSAPHRQWPFSSSITEVVHFEFYARDSCSRIGLALSQSFHANAEIATHSIQMLLPTAFLTKH